MNDSTSAFRFSRRQVTGRAVGLDRVAAALAESVPASAGQDEAALPLTAMVLGVDLAPRRLAPDEVRAFDDAFTSNVILAGHNPLTLRALSDAIGAIPQERAFARRELFVVGEGAHFANSFPAIDRNIRLVITWSRDNTSPPDILLSTEVDLDGPSALLQVIAWSESGGAFHFFERHRGGRGWIWAGSSLHALQPESRGKGPFDSHVNGGLVMKELKAPWVHWHSMSASIPRELAFPGADLANHPLFRDITGAEHLETITRAGVLRWTRRRMLGDIADGRLDNVTWYARQLLWTTSVNLVSSTRLAERLAEDERLELPYSFFYDKDSVDFLVDALTDGMERIDPGQPLTVLGSLYRDALQALDVHVEDHEHGGTRIPGDTQFAFVVPERAMEDLAVLRELVAREAMSARLALSMMLVDFCNPVFSPRRAALLPYFPDDVGVGNGGTVMDTAVIDAIRAAGAADGTPESDLLRWWDSADLVTSARARVATYLQAVAKSLSTSLGANGLLRLADARREAFRQRSLNEFRHTTARNGVLVSLLEMSENGLVISKTSDLGEKEL